MEFLKCPFPCTVALEYHDGVIRRCENEQAVDLLETQLVYAADVGVMFRDDRAGGVEDAEFFRVDFHDVTVIRGVDVGDDSGAIQGIGKGAHATAAADAAHLGNVEVFQGLRAAHVDVHVRAQGEFR